MKEDLYTRTLLCSVLKRAGNWPIGALFVANATWRGGRVRAYHLATSCYGAWERCFPSVRLAGCRCGCGRSQHSEAHVTDEGSAIEHGYNAAGLYAGISRRSHP